MSVPSFMIRLRCPRLGSSSSSPLAASRERERTLQRSFATSGSTSTASPIVTTNGRLRMIILGAPGAGKGTHSSRVVKKYEVETIVVGDLLRDQINKGTKVGDQASEVMRKGGLLPDELVMKLIEPGVNELSEKSWILDGLPRTLGQARLLDAFLAHKGTPLNLVVNLDVPDRVILDRIENRWIHRPSGRVYNTTFNPPKIPGKDDLTGEPLTKRIDDDPSVFAKRLTAYYRENLPIVDYFSELDRRQSGGGIPEKLVTLRGETSDEIWPKLERVLGERFPTLGSRG